MHQVYLLLGCNLGNCRHRITQALGLIEEGIGQIVKKSALYESEPWGFQSDSNFLNLAVRVETNLQAVAILDQINHIEKLLGRTKRSNGYKSRCIDIDILFYDDQLICHPELTVPHPLLHERMFALKPLQEIDPWFIHPVLDQTIAELVDACPDCSHVSKLK